MDRTGSVVAHANNFGALRLLLATLVIVGHSPPLASARSGGGWGETLVQTIAPHELAVDGFFLLSGYLITISVLRSRTAPYLRKRICRIYPGFAVAYVVSLIAAFTAGGAFAGGPIAELGRHALAILRLSQPDMTGAYAGNPYPVVNGSLWTCSYEFACYLLVLALHRLGLLERRLLVLGVVMFVIALGTVAVNSNLWWLHKMSNPLRLGALFLAGGLFYLYRERVRYRHDWALISLFGLSAALFSRWTYLPAAALLGGYLLFWSGLHQGSGLIRRIGQDTDISFGVYLYAWPIQSLLVWHIPGIGPWAVCLLTIPLAAAAGFLSWTLVEKHFIRRAPIGRAAVPEFR